MPEHVVALAMIVDGDHVLLAHRHPGRQWYPDCWDLIGGHLEPNEEPLEAVKRECQEELGVAVHAAEPLAMSSSDPAVEVHAFAIRRWTGTPSNRATEEHDDLRWFQAAELAQLHLADPAVLPVILEVLNHGTGT